MQPAKLAANNSTTDEASTVAVAFNLGLAVLVEIIGAFGPLMFASALWRQKRKRCR